jgi:hypothetical protein
MTPEEIAADLERQAAALEAEQKTWSSAYSQIEDMGQTSTRIRELRTQAERIRASLRPDEKTVGGP